LGFPKRLEDIAAEIQAFNRHQLIRPDVWIKARDLPPFVSDSFSNLPQLLRIYATYLRYHFDYLTRSMRAPRGQVLDTLLKLVRRETGQAMYTEVSEILTATAAQTRSLTDADFTPDSLKIRWQRIGRAS
jgi:hypothetical protein